MRSLIVGFVLVAALPTYAKPLEPELEADRQRYMNETVEVCRDRMLIPAWQTGCNALADYGNILWNMLHFDINPQDIAEFGLDFRIDPRWDIPISTLALFALGVRPFDEDPRADSYVPFSRTVEIATINSTTCRDRINSFWAVPQVEAVRESFRETIRRKDARK